jgi:hypothetical protein
MVQVILIQMVQLALFLVFIKEHLLKIKDQQSMNYSNQVIINSVLDIVFIVHLHKWSLQLEKMLIFILLIQILENLFWAKNKFKFLKPLSIQLMKEILHFGDLMLKILFNPLKLKISYTLNVISEAWYLKSLIFKF